MELIAYTLEQAAAALGISVPTMRKLIEKSDDFPVLKSGRRMIIPKEGLNNWLMQEAEKRTCID